MNERLRKLYFSWLLNYVCEDKAQFNRYSFVLHQLYSKYFRFVNEMDENLIEWALYLREDFYESSPTVQKMIDIYGKMEEDCSILEIMVSLAVNCEEKIMTNGTENRTSLWFWSMFDSLGLTYYENSRYERREVSDILDRFLNLDYAEDGKGGLFTLKNCDKNVTEIDIWMQMNEWLIENFS